MLGSTKMERDGDWTKLCFSSACPGCFEEACIKIGSSHWLC